MTAIEPRPYAGAADFPRLRAYLIEAKRLGGPPRLFHVGDLNWWLYYVMPPPLHERLFLWLRPDGELAAFAFLDYVQGSYELQAHPDLTGNVSLKEVHRWCEDRLLQRLAGGLIKAVLDSQDKRRIELLLEDGYTREPDWHAPLLERPLDRLEPAVSSAAYRLRPIHMPIEAAARADLHRQVWQTSRMTTEAYRALVQAPDYVAGLDMVAVDPAGKLVACALGWLDWTNRLGHLEPVGTLPGVRRQGLARAVVLACLKKLKDQGMERVQVVTHSTLPAAIALYQSLGFREVGALHRYQLRVPIIGT